MLTEKQAKKMYDLGAQAQTQYKTLRDAIIREVCDCSWSELKAFSMGYNGTVWEVKTWKRYGDIPATNGEVRPSYNFMDQVPERGVSVITDEWKRTIHGMFFEAKNGNRKVVTFRGVYTGYNGGDDEPLVLPVK